MIKISIECEGCNSSCILLHDMEEHSYDHVENCPFCGSDQIDSDIEQDYQHI
jgi:hypothetical protein